MVEPSSRPWLSWPVLGTVGFVALIHVVWWMTGDQIATQGGFADGDSYLRLLRVERLIETWDWFDISIPDANAPFGTTLHWTRLFDLVLLALAAPLVPFLGFSKALFWAGIIISPVIHILSAGALAWALIPVLGRTGACIAGALTASQAGMLSFSLVGRADHHMMFILLGVLALGFVFRILTSPEASIPSARWAGVFLALGIWEGPENIVFMALCLGAIGLPWLKGEADSGRRNFGVAQGLAIGLLIAILLERGATGAFAVEYDRLSIIHLAFAVLLMVYWVVVITLDQRRADDLSPLARVAIAGLGVVVLVVVMTILFPKILGNPLNDANPAIQPIYERISEYRGISGADRFLIYFGSILFVGPWLIWKLKSEWGRGLFWAWALIAAGTLVYVTFGLNWLRWCMYAALFLSIVLADMIVAADSRINEQFRFPSRVAVKVLVMIVLTVGPMFAGALLLNASKTEAEKAADDVVACPVSELSAFLNQKPWSDRSRIIAASANFGAELIYRTDHQALATVHHRNVSGILDGHRILNSADDEAIKTIIRKRQVDLILLCPESSDDSYFLLGEEKNALYPRLVSGEVPNWMVPVNLPGELADKFRLFEIRHPL